MINGDIDLTTNLDFYHDKKQLPVYKNDTLFKNKKNKREHDYNKQYEYYNLEEIFYDYQLNNTNYQVFYTDDYSDYISSNYTITYNGDSTTINSIDFSGLYNTTPLYYSLTTNYSSTNSTNNKYISVSKPKKDIFGCDIRKESVKGISKKYCANCGRTYYLGKCRCKKDRIKSVDISNKKNYSLAHDNHDDIIELLKRKKRSMFNKSTVRFPRRKIPWLRNLSSRVYEDYMKDLYEEQDYSSYLTDMGWLGIHR